MSIRLYGSHLCSDGCARLIRVQPDPHLWAAFVEECMAFFEQPIINSPYAYPARDELLTTGSEFLNDLEPPR